MFEKINFSGIVRDHVDTLKDYRTGTLRVRDLVLFFGVPFVPTIVLPWRTIYLAEGAVATMITAMAVFGALLFNLIVLVYDVAGRTPSSPVADLKMRRRFLREIHANVAFSVLLSLLSIVVLLPAVLSTSDGVRDVVSVVFYYVLTLFLLTLLMVLKRMHVLLGKDIEAGSGDSPGGG